MLKSTAQFFFFAIIGSIMYHTMLFPMHLSRKDIDLHAAVHADKRRIVENLLSRGANVNARISKDCRTPLHWAAWHGYVELVKLLCKQSKIIVSALDEERATPLHLAMIAGYSINKITIAKILLEHGADVNAANKFGNTCLHRASLQGYGGMIEILLSAGADTNACNAKGITPLHFFVEESNAVGVEMLLAAKRKKILDHLSLVDEQILSAKPNLEIESNNHKTPLSLAVEDRNMLIIRLLLAAGAQTHKAQLFLKGKEELNEADQRILELLIRYSLVRTVESLQHDLTSRLSATQCPRDITDSLIIPCLLYEPSIPTNNEQATTY